MPILRLAMLMLLAPAVLAVILSAPAFAQTPGSLIGEPIDGRRVALIVGNSDYPEGSSWTDLPNAANDAAFIAELIGNEERGSARFETHVVTDGTKDEILAALARFGEAARGADIALVYFSGHGFEFERENYIVPIDAPARVVEGELIQHFISMTEIVQAADVEGLTMFFLDACRVPGPVVAANRQADGDRAMLFGAIEAPESVVFYATAIGDVAYDAAPEDAPLSPFASAVARAVSYPGLDIPYVFNAVRDQVLRSTEIFAPPQQPVFTGSWSRPFYFVPAGMNEIEPPALPTAAAPAQPASRGAAADTGSPAPLDIPLSVLSTLDENILIVRVFETHSPDDLIALAEAGDPVALYLVGYMYEFGAGVEQDLAEARRWLERAAETGHPAGQLEFGYFLSRHGAADERDRALALIEAAAAQDYAKAMSHLGAVLMDGLLGPRDPERAEALYRDAAALGHAWAHYALALRRQDIPAQIAALQALARDGNREGDNWLCELSQSGFGIDVEAGFAHCLEAARAGYTVPRAYTAMRYATGNGVAASDSRARFWARVAADSFDISDVLRARMNAILSED